MTTRVVVSITCINGDNPARRAAVAKHIKARLDIVAYTNWWISQVAIADTAISIHIEEIDEEQTAK